jgi:nucleoside-diphosphate-sugar epimerase
MARTVLITGSAGRLGQAGVVALRDRGWIVRGFDLVRTPHADESIIGDITSGEALGDAAAGVDAIIHLAACPDDDDFLTKLLPPNIIGVYEVCEAARLAGIKRLVIASSGQVVWWQRFTGPFPIRVDTPPSPRGWYACTKLFAEAAARVYAETQKADVIAARLGWCPRTPEHAEELAATGWGQDVYLSTGDAGRFFAATIERPGPIGFQTVFATSRPVKKTYVDLEPARAVLGYEPLDQYPDGIEFGTPDSSA